MSEKTKRRRLSFTEKYELIKEVKADALKECTLNKYRITDRMYNRVLDKEPEVIVKVKSCEFQKVVKNKFGCNENDYFTKKIENIFINIFY